MGIYKLSYNKKQGQQMFTELSSFFAMNFAGKSPKVGDSDGTQRQVWTPDLGGTSVFVWVARGWGRVGCRENRIQERAGQNSHQAG